MDLFIRIVFVVLAVLLIVAGFMSGTYAGGGAIYAGFALVFFARFMPGKIGQ